MQMIKKLTLTGAQIHALAAGGGDAETIEMLEHGQFNKFLLMLVTINQAHKSPALSEAMALLSRAQIADPIAYRRVLTYPHVMLWASVFLDRIVGASQLGTVQEHERYLSCVAAVAAWRAGVDFEISTSIGGGGGVVLPSLGRVLIGVEDNELATISSTNGQLCIGTSIQTVMVPSEVHCDADNWEAIRELIVSRPNAPTLRLLIDDVDPYRNQFELAALAAPLPRLEDVDFKLWCEMLTNAWYSLTERHGLYASGIAAAMRVIVPLFDEAHVRRHDHHHHAFGAIAMTRPSSSFWVKQSILEESQRMKLTAMHQLSALHTAIPGDSRHEVPWVELPMSFDRVLEGIYALPAVAEFWATQIEDGPTAWERANAQLDFVRWSSWIDGMRHRVERSDELTKMGRLFVSQIPFRRSLPDVSGIDSHLPALARRIQIDHSLSWRLQNLLPDGEAIERLADIWMMGSLCPTNMASWLWSKVEVGSESVSGWSVRRRLAMLERFDPQQFANLQSSPTLCGVIEPSARDVDFLLVQNQFDDAIKNQVVLLKQGSGDRQTWAALSVACAWQAETQAHTLGRFPELVRALHDSISKASGEYADPTALATWLSPLLLLLDIEAFETEDPYQPRRSMRRTFNRIEK